MTITEISIQIQETNLAIMFFLSPSLHLAHLNVDRLSPGIDDITLVCGWQSRGGGKKRRVVMGMLGRSSGRMESRWVAGAIVA